jgi:hypothetical protein
MPDADNLTEIGGITSIDEIAVLVSQPTRVLIGDPVINAAKAAELRKKIEAELPPAVFGDSVVLGARAILRESLGEIAIDAEVSRSPETISERILVRHTERKLGQVVVIHMGTNGKIRDDVLRKTIEGLADRERVVVVNVRVPRSWMKPNNKIMIT